MCEIKRGVVMLIQAGDPEICEPLKVGMLAGREQATGDGGPHPSALRAATFPTRGRLLEGAVTGGRLEEAQRQTVEAEMDRQAILEGMREAIGNTKTPEDYAHMRYEAEVEYGEPVYYPTRMERFADGLLALYGLLVCGLSAAFHAQDHILGG